MEERPTSPVPPAPRPRRRGCLFWGCGSVLLVVLVIAGFLGYLGYTLGRFLGTEPVPVTVYRPGPGEAEGVRERLEAFSTRVEAGDPTRVELSADDLNAMIVGAPGGDEWAGKVFARIEGEQLWMDLSVPLEKLPVERRWTELLGGRYLNAKVLVDVRLEKGEMAVSVKEGTANGRPLPGWFLSALHDQNLLGAFSDSRLTAVAKRAKRIDVKDGKLVIETGE